MIPTQRSVIARLRYRSLDGEWIDVSLWRATRIRAFPKNAVMDKKALMTERKMSSPCTSPVNSAEHKNSATVCRLSPLVKFCISKTFLRCGYSQLNSFLIHLSSLHDNRQSWYCLCAAVLLGSKLAQLTGFMKTSWTVSNKKSINQVTIDSSVTHIFKLGKERFSTIARNWRAHRVIAGTKVLVTMYKSSNNGL